MNKLLGLIRRNMLIYFKDKSAVLFSMLTPIIVLSLYILFLKGNFVNSITAAAEALSGYITEAHVDSFANGFLLAGILGSALITVPYNCLSTVVKDRENNVDRDIMVTPVSRVQIVLGYFIASALSAFIMTSAIVTAGLVLLNSLNSMYMPVKYVVYLFLTVLLGSVSGTAFFMPIMLLMKNSSVSGAFMGIVSAASGFIIGAYLPTSGFPDGVQTVCTLFPATGITIMTRYLCLNGLLDHINEILGGIDNGIFVDTLRNNFTFSGNIAGRTISVPQLAVYVLAVTIAFLIAISAIYPGVYKKK